MYYVQKDYRSHFFLFYLLFVLFPIFIVAQNTTTLVIGNQEWMAYNIDSIVPESFVFNQDTLSLTKYGVYYNWETALTICPKGFHLPSDKEWTELTSFLGGLDVAGTKLLMGGSSNFNAPLAGNYNREFSVLSFFNKKAYFWTSSAFNANVAWIRQLGRNQRNVNRTTVEKDYFFSVRCLKD